MVIGSRKMASSFIDAWYRWATTWRPNSSSVVPNCCHVAAG